MVSAATIGFDVAFLGLSVFSPKKEGCTKSSTYPPVTRQQAKNGLHD